MTVSIAIRPATPADSRACYGVFLAAITDLTARMNMPWRPDPGELWTRLGSTFEYLSGHAAEWWLAEQTAHGRVVGYARSVQRGGLFELSEFFVDPQAQSAGVGRRLLERAFPANRGTVRVVIATTDVRALRRYHAAGTFARFPIAALEGAPRADAPLDPGLVPVKAGLADVPALQRIEAAVLDFDRGEEFDWLLTEREAYIYYRDGAEVAFAFVGPHGLGPIAALEPADMVGVLAHVESWAAGAGRKEIGFEVPMVNEAAMTHLLARGFRMDPFFTFLLSSRPFGRFDRFIGMSPPFVL